MQTAAEKTTHSPGPWHIEPSRFDGYEIVAPRANCKRLGVGNEWTIAKVGSPEFWDDQDFKSRDEADARLMSASPEMADALEANAALLERLAADPRLASDAALDDVLAAATAARVILAKARGRA